MADIELEAEVGGTAALAPELVLTDLIVEAEVDGAATVSNELRIANYLFESEVEGDAYFNPATLEILRQVTSPGVNPASQDQLKFYVNGSLVDLSTTSRFNLGDLRVSYDGKYLNFNEITQISSPTWQPEHVVQLDVKFGGVFKTQFKGKIKTRSHVGENNNEEVEYEATGYQALANDVTLLNTNGYPTILFTASNTVTLGSSLTTVLGKDISVAIQEVFAISAARLTAAGIPYEIGAPGLEAFSGKLPESVSLRNLGFFAGIQQLASFEPAIKPFFDDVQQKWVFINLLTAPTAVIAVNSLNVTDLNYSASTDDRYTAVRLYADPLEELVTTHASTRNGGYVTRSVVTLENDWPAEIESTWNSFLGCGGDNPEWLEDDMHWVFRRFSIPEGSIDREPGTPIRIRQKSRKYATDLNSITGAPVEIVMGERWATVQGKVNFKKRKVVTSHPLIERGDPYNTGEAQGPLEVTLTYWPRGSYNFTYVSSLSSAGTPTLSTTLQDSTSFIAQIRYPAEGFDGTAYSELGIERELAQIVSTTEVTTANAAAILASHKDVVYSGSIPVDGDMIEIGPNLGYKVRVNHSTKNTGLHNTEAMMTAYRYSFGKRGRNTLSISTDVAGLIRV